MAITAEAAYQHLIAESARRVEQAATSLHQWSEAARSQCDVGTWSPAQVVGHLWDSVQVNHLRILRACERGDLLMPGYDQDAWIQRQDPDALPWGLLVDGWRADNLRLLHLAARVDPVLRQAPRPKHSLARIAWQPFGEDQTPTLEDLIRDYLGHLWHHLQRLDPRLLPPFSLPPGLGQAELPLEGPRLRLRPFLESDVAPVAAMLADEAVVRHLPGPPRSLEQSRRTVAWFQRQHERDGCSAWALELKSGGPCLGWCGLAEFDNTGEVELLYCLAQGAWGQGLATEAARLCVDCAREQLGLPVLVAAVDPPNQASSHVLAKCGFAPWRQGRRFGMLLDLYRLDLGR